MSINLTWLLPGMNVAKSADEWSTILVKAISENIEWKNNLRTIEVITGETIEGEIEKIGYKLKQPAKLKLMVLDPGNPESITLSKSKNMTDRDTIISEFLAASGWKNAIQTHLAGDASFRRYQRI